ncbi:MAG: hemerythrin domain-containing protein [Acidimicrobiales bacterium]
MTGDTLDRLVEEHRSLERLFDELASTSDTTEEEEPVLPAAKKKALILHISRVISTHEDVEASILGPFIRSRLAEGHRLSRSQRRRYHQTEKLLAIIARRSISSPDLSELLTQATEAVVEVMAEQESTTFPQIRAALRGDDLAQLEHKEASARRHASTRPHPYVSHRGALARLIRAVLAFVDKLRDHIVPRL